MLRPEPRPAALAVEGDHHARPAPALHEPRRHDPDHARVPALPRHHDRGLVRLRRAGGLGGEQDARLGLLAVAVQEVELAGHLAGARGVVGEEQLERGVGSLHAPGGVDARAEPEPERVLGELARRHAADLHQRAQARPCGCARAPRAPRARCGGSRRAAARGRRPWRARRGRCPRRPRPGRDRRRRTAPRSASAPRPRRTAPGSRSRRAPDARRCSRAAPRRAGGGR